MVRKLIPEVEVFVAVIFWKKRKLILSEDLAVKDMTRLDRLNWWVVLQKVIRMKKIWKQRSPSWLDCSDQNDKKIVICGDNMHRMKGKKYGIKILCKNSSKWEYGCCLCRSSLSLTIKENKNRYKAWKYRHCSDFLRRFRL